MANAPVRTPYLFLSHASADKPLARKLITTLAAAGVDTFLDERDIRVGENIPERLYSELAKATHVVYIVSLASIASRWVREELSVAKMREQEEHGCRVLPILADDVDIPTPVRHIKYADFRLWRDPEHYLKAAQSLLHALGFETPSFDEADLRFYNSYMTTVDSLYRTVFELQAFISAGMLARFGVAGSVTSGWQFDLAVWVVKQQIESIDFVELRRFPFLIQSGASSDSPGRISQVIAEVRELLMLIQLEREIQASDLRDALNCCRKITGMLEVIRVDFVAALAPAALLAEKHITAHA